MPLSDSLKLGKKAKKPGIRSLQLRNYFTKVLAPPPIRYSAIPFLDWGMMVNDTAGDCTIADMGHYIMNVNAYNYKTVVPPDNSIITAYTAVTALENNGQGYDPSTGANDNGCVFSDVLNYCKATGIDGHTVDIFACYRSEDQNAR